MTAFTEEYAKLLIHQYYDKPKAKAETKLYASETELIYNFFKEFETRFDLDQATDDRLDLIGKMVGQFREGDIDDDYRFFIKAKIIKNIAHCIMSSDDKISIQSAVQNLFEGKAFAVDNQDMTLSLYVDDTADLTKISKLISKDLLPKPQGVHYRFAASYRVGETFGFAENINSLSFGLGRFAQVIG